MWSYLREITFNLNWSVLKAGFWKCHHRPQHRLPLGCELRKLLIAASTDCFWCSLLHWKCDQAMHLALPPSHCKPVLSSIPIHNNSVGQVWRPGWPIVGTTTSDPLPRETIVQEISNFTWRMRRSSVMLEIHTTSFIQRHILQKSGQFLLQKSEICLSCKMTFQDERTNQLIIQNCTPHIDTKT